MSPALTSSFVRGVVCVLVSTVIRGVVSVSMLTRLNGGRSETTDFGVFGIEPVYATVASSPITDSPLAS